MHKPSSIQPGISEQPGLQLLQAAFDAVLVLDAQGQVQWSSPSCTALLGCSAEELQVQPPWQLLSGTAPGHMPAEALQTQLAAGRPFRYEALVACPPHAAYWFRIKVQPLPVAAGTAAQWVALLDDCTAEKATEQALRHAEQASDQRWQLAMERFGDGAWEFNYQTGKEYFSAAYRTMLGYSEEEFAHRPQTWLSHVHPDDVAVSLRASEAYLSGAVPIYSVERRLRCQNGNYKWVLTRGLITKTTPDGQPLVMTGVHTDISALKNAAAAIEAARLRLSTTIANFQEGILLEDEQRRVVLANEAICQLFGSTVSPAVLVGLDARRFGQAAKDRFRDEEAFIDRYEALVRQRQLVIGEQFVMKDGRVLQCDFVPISLDATSIGYLWKFQDITERRTREDALRRREEKYRGIIENMKMGLVERNLAGEITYVNHAFCDITGFPAAEFLGRQALPQLLQAADAEMVAERIRNRQQGVAETYELAIMTKAGQRKWVLISGAASYDDARRPHGSISIILDITHQKELEHNLRAAKELAEESARGKELFLANMSHEIRTPMNAILGMSQLLAKTPLDDRQQSYLHAIATSGDNLLVIINDILDLSKLSASQMTVERIGFSLNDLLHQVEKSLYFKAEEKGLCFRVAADEHLPEVVLGDPYRLTQVLLNLAGNAIKFTEKGHVQVACELLSAPAEAAEVALRFVVADTGIGIDADFLRDIFKEFSQEDSSVTRKFGGTGLGLSISRGLVELMGGAIEIESEKNAGTRTSFVLRLPVGSSHDVPRKTAVTAELRARLRGRRVLLVEDNAFNRQIAKGFLQNAGLVVTEAENGAIAVALAREQPFDVILMDVQMPVMNGLDATAHLRQPPALPTPIIALTANAIKGEREKCLAAGMNDYLAKPFQEDDLLKVIGHWTLGEPLAEPAAEETVPEATAALPAALYNLGIIYQIGQGDPDFTVLMLESFIESAQEAVQDLQAARQTRDVALLRATTHKLRPSLEHLQVQQALPAVAALDAWAGSFDAAQLTPLIDQLIQWLEMLLVQLHAELQAARMPENR